MPFVDIPHILLIASVVSNAWLFSWPDPVWFFFALARSHVLSLIEVLFRSIFLLVWWLPFHALLLDVFLSCFFHPRIFGMISFFSMFLILFLGLRVARFTHTFFGAISSGRIEIYICSQACYCSINGKIILSKNWNSCASNLIQCPYNCIKMIGNKVMVSALAPATLCVQKDRKFAKIGHFGAVISAVTTS